LVTNEIKYVIIIAVGIMILLLGVWFAFGELNPFYDVASGSMIPNLNINDFVIVSHNVPFNSLKVGDIHFQRRGLMIIRTEESSMPSVISLW
jgi:signal peptidase I